VPRLLPRLALEPPPSYVAFVAEHVDPLRREAAGVFGDEEEADRLYPEVLVDVAVRWRRLELLGRCLRRPGLADTYLRRAFVRRCQRWRPERLELSAQPEIEVWSAESVWLTRPPRRSRSSGATRQAPFLSPDPRAGDVAEAAVAWWHAYEAHRRRRLIALLVVILLVLFSIGSVAPGFR
jgi:hypothetical protein